MYRIKRAPAHLKSFEMPEKKELKSLVKGNLVKVIFADEFGRYGERMWCEMISIDGDGWIKAKLDNNPACLEMLKRGQKVKFHVTDIIMVYPSEE